MPKKKKIEEYSENYERQLPSKNSSPTYSRKNLKTSDAYSSVRRRVAIKPINMFSVKKNRKRKTIDLTRVEDGELSPWD